MSLESLTDRPAEFAGRDRELVRLDHALLAAHHGQGGVVLLSGEPGIGKTRLAEELSARARGQHDLVLWGRCYEGEGAPAFWPWSQILRDYVQQRELATLRAELGPSAADLVALAPEVQLRLPATQPAPPIDGTQARFRLFDGLTGVLVRVARAQPLVLVFDDLHWADAPSLLLLQHLAGALTAASILVIGTYRDSDVDELHPLTSLIAGLTRLGVAQQLSLDGLTAAPVAGLITATTGYEPSAALLHSVMDATAGNPFFVTQLARLLAQSPSPWAGADDPSRLIRIPPGARAVILQRVQRLSRSCQRLLQVAAVVGRECSLRLLRALSFGSQAEVLSALDEAGRAQLLLPSAEGIGHYRFVHALVRETLYEALPLAERVQLHARVGRALLASSAAKPDSHLAELSYHLFQAAPGGDIELALEYSLRAAAHSSHMLAYEDAVLHYARALQLLELLPADDSVRRCDLLLALGEIHARSGAAGQMRATFTEAAVLARGQSDPLRLARAALGLAGIVVTPGVVDAQVVALLTEALDALGDDDSALRARLLGRLAMEYRYSPLRERRDAASAAAVAIARRLDDQAELALALQARHYALLAPDTLDRRMAISLELSQLAELSGNREVLLRSMPWRIADLLDLGHVQAADRAIAETAQLAAELRQPLYAWYAAMFQAQRALMRGEMAAGEELAEAAHALGRQVQPHASQVYYAAQLFLRRREQGRLPELVPQFTSILEQYPGMPIFRCWMALAHLQDGQSEAAAALLSELCADRCAALPWDQLWLGAITALAEVAIAVHNRAAAAVLYELLLPFAGRNVMVGIPISMGAAALYLGQLAAAGDDTAAAVRHYEHAIALNHRLGIRVFLARTQVAYAALVRSARRSDAVEALLREASALVDPQELPVLAAQLANLAGESDSLPQTLHGLSERELATLRLIARGQPTKAIARELAVSVSTIERHITHLYAKIGVRSRAEATAFAIRHHLL